MWRICGDNPGHCREAGLIALIRALELSERNTVNIYTDSRYACFTLQVFKEKSLLNSTRQGKEQKKKERPKESVKTEKPMKTGETDTSAWAGAGPVPVLGPHLLAEGAAELGGRKKKKKKGAL